MRRCYRLLVFTALLLCLGTSMLAQATSSLRGKVADAQGGALPGVTVVLANTETAFNRQVVTDETGSYSLLQVPPGAYTITAELPGFQTASATLALQVNTPATLDLKMEIAGLAESVRGRGVRLEGARGYAGLLSPLVAGSLERATGLAEAMEARGFGRSGTTRAPRPPWSTRDRLALVASVLIVVVALWL